LPNPEIFLTAVGLAAGFIDSIAGGGGVAVRVISVYA
jgi:uncharacterized membrane protein YfcA